jgi:hypothetical protein
MKVLTKVQKGPEKGTQDKLAQLKTKMGKA